VGRQDRNCRNEQLGWTRRNPQPRDSERGNSDYYPCETRAGARVSGGNGTRIRIPSGMDERERGNGHVSFTERNEMRNGWVNQIREREESSGRKKLSMPVQEGVQFVISSERES